MVATSLVAHQKNFLVMMLMCGYFIGVPPPFLTNVVHLFFDSYLRFIVRESYLDDREIKI